MEKASYISRSVLVSEYDGQTYRPKYHEDLVHSEISLSPNALEEFADRAPAGTLLSRQKRDRRRSLQEC